MKRIAAAQVWMLRGDHPVEVRRPAKGVHLVVQVVRDQVAHVVEQRVGAGVHFQETKPE